MAEKWQAGLYLALAIVLCSVSAGCLGEKNPSASQQQAPAILVDYYRNGGPAGVNDRLVVFGNGAALIITKNASRSITLNATELERITTIFDQAQFSTLQDNYPSHRGENGLYQYSISYQGKTVSMEESAYPALVGPVINELDQIVSGNRL